ncbi:sugar ABC transporter ATP-binding protein [Erysipelotrichaceae bacterium OttesenSCG-928-M19]|nr:sugar ABC transporter ATP-binding protein [Erysipelotrichaceae bacterium OttesenSCG-928-M19]
MKVEFKGINKSFNGVQVLNDISFTIDGKIHALMGENGAGKSTLMKILTGVYQSDEGQVIVDGIEKKYTHPKEAEKDGIIFIHQELNILPFISVTDNIFLNKEITKGIFVKQKEMDQQARSLLNELGLDIDVTKEAGQYSVGQQQIIEIAKALKEHAKLIIMDEPTAALSEKETVKLFEIINNLKKQGIGIIYISHRIEEVFMLCDKISVLRDGSFIETLMSEQTTRNDVIRLMVGREIVDIYPKKLPYQDDIVLQVNNISKINKYQDVSFELHKGEILGFAGLMGAGRTEVMHGVFGSDPYDEGSIIVNGKKIKNRIEDSIKNKIAFITEDRKNEGIITEFNIKDNIIMTNYDSIAKKGRISNKMQNQVTTEYIELLKIKCSGLQHLLKKMSGGNQQKVVIGKWLNINPSILIMDEPTRGVDVGAKQEIYSIMKELCEEEGISIILVSSEMPEVLGMSDRVAVMHEGRLVDILNREEASQENVMKLATGGNNNV